MSDTFRHGWEYYAKAMSAGMAAQQGKDYCADVESAIDTFAEEMYKIVQEHGNLGVGQCKGFVAEAWHAETFNINAAVKGSAHRAFVDKSNDLGSVDVSTNFGHDYSMKYIRDAKASADAQAKNYYENYHEYLNKPRKSEPLSFDEYLQKYGIENTPEDLLKSVQKTN